MTDGYCIVGIDCCDECGGDNSTCGGSGNVNGGDVDVTDLVAITFVIVELASFDSCQFNEADINSDGVLNIYDIVIILNLIIWDTTLSRGEEVSSSTLYFGNGMVSYKADGNVAGIQLEVSGEFTITSSHLPAGWEMVNHNKTIILFTHDGSTIDPGTLFEYTGDMKIESALVADWYGSDVLVSSVLIPEEYILDAAYPNPFNPVTNISFSLPENQDITLQVYNLQGQAIETLVHGNMEAGYHTMQWNADNHVSGIYFVRMIAGEYVNSQKLILLK